MENANAPSKWIRRLLSSDTAAFLRDFLAFDRRRVVQALLLVVLGGAIEGAGIVLIIPLLETISSGSGDVASGAVDQVFVWTGVSGKLERLGFLLGVIALMMIGRAFLLAWRQIALSQLELDYLRSKQMEMIRCLANAPWKKIARLRHARVTHLLSNDVHRIGQAATGLLQSIVAILILTMQVGIALWLDWLLTLIALGLLSVAGVMGSTLIRAARELGVLVIGSNLRLLNDAGQFLGALKLSMSQNLQFRFVDDFDASLGAINEEEIRFIRRQNLVRQRLTIIASIVGAATAFTGFGILDIDPATVIVLLVILSRMSGPMGQLQSQALELIRSLPAFAHMRELKAELDPGPLSQRALVPPHFGDIAFDRVSYSHAAPSASAPTAGLREFSVTIAAGSFLGIAGSSGAGKTTFADLLVGLYEPDGGAISIDGKRVELARTPQWRDMISYVSQDAFLKHDTIRANLLWSQPSAEDRLSWALTISGADAVVARLPEGLETVVGERGTLISGGERQRLAIARALLREPRLLILDEATNAIDVRGEALLLDQLNGLRPGMTIVTIAHRLETLQFCDRVIILENGTIVADGTFDALRSRLTDAQLREYESPAPEEQP